MQKVIELYIYIYTYTFFFFRFFSIIGYYRIVILYRILKLLLWNLKVKTI